MLQWSPIPPLLRRAFQTRAITMPTTCFLAQATQLSHNDGITAPRPALALGVLQQALQPVQAQLAGLQAA